MYIRSLPPKLIFAFFPFPLLSATSPWTNHKTWLNFFQANVREIQPSRVINILSSWGLAKGIISSGSAQKWGVWPRFVSSRRVLLPAYTEGKREGKWFSLLRDCRRSDGLLRLPVFAEHGRRCWLTRSGLWRTNWAALQNWKDPSRSSSLRWDLETPTKND